MSANASVANGDSANGVPSGGNFGIIDGWSNTAVDTTGISIQTFGGHEDRPVNVYLNWIIKE
jgi:hypothetical protein